MTRDEMIEVMARAIDEDPWDYTLSHSPNQCCPDCNAARSAAIERAVEALSALESAGYVVVPREPTPEMLDAFIEDAVKCDGLCNGLVIDNPRVGYAAMLSAAKQEKTDG